MLLLKSDNPTRNKSNPPYGARPGLGTPTNHYYPESSCYYGRAGRRPLEARCIILCVVSSGSGRSGFFSLSLPGCSAVPAPRATSGCLTPRWPWYSPRAFNFVPLSKSKKKKWTAAVTTGLEGGEPTFILYLNEPVYCGIFCHYLPGVS